VEQLGAETDPHAADPGRWGHSLVNLAEIMLPCLDAAGARSVIEVGAYAGDLTEVLVEWAAGSGAKVWAIDPSPQDRLVKLDEQREELELVRETSLVGLPQIPPADAVIVDGDHNYYTVSEELRLIDEAAAGGDLPLLLFHDVCWPHGRRDDYYAAELIPDARLEVFKGAGHMLMLERTDDVNALISEFARDLGAGSPLRRFWARRKAPRRRAARRAAALAPREAAS